MQDDLEKDSAQADVIIVGGGLAGLIIAILLNRKGLKVVLIEKKEYPFHRVCGEYISNEVKPFLEKENLMPTTIQASSINRFRLTSIKGKSKTLALDLGGFGISRYVLDKYLANAAQNEGVTFYHDQVEAINREKESGYSVQTRANGILKAQLVVGAFGKRSILDKRLDRDFFKRPSPYVGVKYHIRYDYPVDLVALHNFSGGYCGINAIEDGKLNLCYLTHRSNVKKHKDITKMETEVLCKNPHLRAIFHEAEFLFDKPEVINEISFATKAPVENDILMCGDAAGMITPLCGNGMAMAIHSAKILAEHITYYFSKHKNWSTLVIEYTKEWNTHFKTRLAVGRTIQQLFGKGFQSNFSIGLLEINPLARFIIKNTHGQPF